MTTDADVIPNSSLTLTPEQLAKVRFPEPTEEHILQFFAYSHLPEKLQAVSRPFGVLASEMNATLPRNPERTVAFRKLLEAKDAAVRALLAK